MGEIFFMSRDHKHLVEKKVFYTWKYHNQYENKTLWFLRIINMRLVDYICFLELKFFIFDYSRTCMDVYDFFFFTNIPFC